MLRTCLDSKFTLLEIENSVAKAKGKSPGTDRVSYPMLKNLSLHLKTNLLDIFNQILNTGKYPHTWRSATIIPISKPKKNLRY